MNLKYSVGLDVSSKKINVCMSIIDEKQKISVKSSCVISNTVNGFKNLQDWIGKHKKEDLPVVICMEATGIYHENCAYYLFENGFEVSIILPNKAKKYLEAIGLKSTNPKVYYNYGLLLNQNKKFKEAESVLLKGITINPSDSELYYALTFVYIQTNNRSKAIQTALKLKQLDPANPNYQQIFNNLGI